MDRKKIVIMLIHLNGFDYACKIINLTFYDENYFITVISCIRTLQIAIKVFIGKNVYFIALIQPIVEKF